jgi:hypothetical protein
MRDLLMILMGVIGTIVLLSVSMLFPGIFSLFIVFMLIFSAIAGWQWAGERQRNKDNHNNKH